MGTVERAVRGQLRRLGLRPNSSGQAAACVTLAVRLDCTEGAAAAAVAARELRIALGAVAAAAESAQTPGWVNRTGLDPRGDPELEDLLKEFST